MRLALLMGLVLAVSTTQAATSGSQTRQLVNRLVFSRDSRFGGLDEIPENGQFFSHRISSANLEAVRAAVGGKAWGELDLASQSGRSMRDFILDNREALQRNPEVLAALTRAMGRKDDVPVVLESGGAPIKVADTARMVSARDVWEQAQGPDASPRGFSSFLAQTYGLEQRGAREQPDDVRAFSVFLNFASGIKKGDLDPDGRDVNGAGLPNPANPSEGLDYLQDHFVRDAGSGAAGATAPGEDAPGLFLPSATSLARVKNLLRLFAELQGAREAGRDPATVTDFDGKTLADHMRRLGVGSAPYDPNAMTAAEIRDAVMGMVSRVVRQEIEQDNDYVFELSSIAHASASSAGTGPGGPGGPGAGGPVIVNPSFVVGNAAATQEQLKIFDRLRGPLTESERTRLEMENSGAFEFRISPPDVESEGGRYGKSYDLLGSHEFIEGGLCLPPPRAPEP